jgi:hypothetical protein
MLQTPFFLFIIFIISLMLSISFGFLNYKINRKTFDFYMMFLIGIAWMVLGFIFKIWFLVLIGAFFLFISITEKSQWKDSVRGFNRAYKNEIHSLGSKNGLIEKIFGFLIFLGILILGWVISFIVLNN